MAKKKQQRSSKSRKPQGVSRRWARRFSILSSIALALLCWAGAWYQRHDRAWFQDNTCPEAIASPLRYFGDRTLMLTDALGLTGHDAVYDCDEPVPEGKVFFAGAPKRVAEPAPKDIRLIDRGSFVIGWSDYLRHPAWVAYHVPQKAKFDVGKRPAFKKDRALKHSPSSSNYERTGYDRGHMAPNHAIASRFGAVAQTNTFLMSNIAPQRPELNRGAWRELEQRIAELWTQRFGEIWVICGTLSSGNAHSRELLAGTAIDVPSAYWMLIAAQAADGVRALALLLPQTVAFDEFPMHRIVTVDELEEATGFDFFPDMPSYLQNAIEADLPTRLWPIRLRDVLKLVMLRFP